MSGLDAAALRGGTRGNAGVTLGSMVQSDRPYVPPASVLALMSHYEIIGVAPTASPEEISRTYKKLALVFHPDKRGAKLTPEEAVYFKAITDAYEVLSDADKRKEYDATLRRSDQNHLNLFNHM